MNNKPFYENIDWSALKKWDDFILSRELLGVGDNGINLVVRSAHQHGVHLEWLDYGETVKFIVHGCRRAGSITPEKIKKVYEMIYDAEKGIRLTQIRKDTNMRNSDLNEILRMLEEEGKIASEMMTGNVGRPTREFWVTL